MKKKNSDASFGVIGLGRFGSALVQTLSEAGKEVIAIDKDERASQGCAQVHGLCLRRGQSGAGYA